MNAAFDTIETGTRIEGVPFSPTRESIREFCDASLDYNPLHLDDDYMKNSFGKTTFGGIIMHGMNNFGVISKMLTDWLYPLGGVPVKPGDTITASAVVTAKRPTGNSQWMTLDVAVRNQRGELVAQGEAMVEFPAEIAA